MVKQAQQQQFESAVTDEIVGVKTTIKYGDQWVTGRVEIVESSRIEPVGWPEVGEVVTHDGVAGEKSELEVEGVDKDKRQPIDLELVGRVGRNEIVEYRDRKRHKVIELENGQKLYEGDLE